MKKVYLLITSALLLLGSSSLWADISIKVGDDVAFICPGSQTGYVQCNTQTYPYSAALYFSVRYSSESAPAVLQHDIIVESPYNMPKGPGFVDLNGYSITSEKQIFCIKNSSVSIIGNGSLNTSASYGIIELYGSVDDVANYSVLSIGKDVTVNAPNGWATTIFSEKHSAGDPYKAFGVVLNVNGTINSKNGITINGSVNQLSGNVPVININDGASVTCSNEDACIYAAGYGIWNIGKATLDAGTIIYAKSGQINIDGAQMTSHASVSTATPNCNGWDTTGDAIVMDTNDCYPGAVQLNITGNAKVLSDNGYAVREVVTKSNASTAIGLVINGDETYLEGGSGAVQLTDYFKDALKDGSSETYQWVLNGVSGGLYTTVPPVVADGYVVEETTISGDTYYKVVPAPASPVAPASQTLYIVNDTKFDYAMDLTNSSAIVVKSGYTLEIKGLTINRTNEADASKVTVESGAKLIVGTEGIQTNNAEGLELLSGENGMGMLLYDGSTTATSPLGTANLYVYSKNIEGGDRIWQHFGIPTQAAPAITKAVPASFNNWDVKKGWVWDGGSATLTEPWVGHNLSVNSDEPGQIIKFAGQLVGNEDATLTLNKYGYNAFANSYTAPVNLKSIVDEAVAMDACPDGAVWVYSAAKAISTGVAKFDSYGADTSEDAALDPMQAFFILHESSSTDNIVLSYNEAVLGQNTRGADASSYNKATFTVTANGEADDFTIYEGEQFSPTSIDKGYDIKQMNHGFIKIFAKQNDENYAKIATNDAEGVELYIETKQAGEYKLSFSNISEGYKISLVDIVTETEVEVAEGNVYTFSVDENTTVKRFRFGKSQVSAYEADANAVNIWVADNALNVAGATEGDAIELINLAGVKVLSATATGEAVQSISLSGIASGAYIVKAGAATVKVIK